jgi:hypothetical protein
MLTRLVRSVHQKLHVLLVDERINPIEVVRLNIYNLFVLIAMRMCSFEKELPIRRAVNPGKPQNVALTQNVKFLEKCILSVIDVMCWGVRNVVDNGVGARRGATSSLSKQEVIWCVLSR